MLMTTRQDQLEATTQTIIIREETTLKVQTTREETMTTKVQTTREKMMKITTTITEMLSSGLEF